MDTKKLRQKILDLAIHGKLVPQDPNDEPASVLLERIKAEKEQLIKEGKIKRQKKSTSSDMSHYGNDVPFEVPKGWIRCKLGDVCAFENGFAFSSNNYTLSGTPLIRISNITSENSVTLDNCVYVQSNVDDRFIVSEGDLLIALSGATTGKMGVYTFSDKAYLNQRVGNLKVFDKTSVLPDYRNVFMMSRSEMILNLAYGGAQPNISGTVICDFDFPLPPIAEQRRIVTEVNRYFSIIDFIETEIPDLKDSVKKAKSKVMELALNGKLTSDTSHYPQLPERWKYKQLEDVLDYEQPQKYIVESTEYSDDYTTPVLTAGKSFIIGHTNEQSGIYTDVPVIIFDDFTTDSKFVDFPFKVKSSAMKILHPKGDINLKYLAYFMSNTRLIGTTHKRYWISEYSKIKVPIPPKEEQDKIVFLIEKFYSLLDSLFVDQS